MSTPPSCSTSSLACPPTPTPGLPAPLGSPQLSAAQGRPRALSRVGPIYSTLGPRQGLSHPPPRYPGCPLALLLSAVLPGPLPGFPYSPLCPQAHIRAGEGPAPPRRPFSGAGLAGPAISPSTCTHSCPVSTSGIPPPGASLLGPLQRTWWGRGRGVPETTAQPLHFTGPHRGILGGHPRPRGAGLFAGGVAAWRGSWLVCKSSIVCWAFSPRLYKEGQESAGTHPSACQARGWHSWRERGSLCPRAGGHRVPSRAPDNTLW